MKVRQIVQLCTYNMRPVNDDLSKPLKPHCRLAAGFTLMLCMLLLVRCDVDVDIDIVRVWMNFYRGSPPRMPLGIASEQPHIKSHHHNHHLPVIIRLLSLHHGTSTAIAFVPFAWRSPPPAPMRPTAQRATPRAAQQTMDTSRMSPYTSRIAMELWHGLLPR